MNAPESREVSPASQTTMVIVCSPAERSLPLVSFGVAPSYSVSVSVITLAPLKNGPLMLIVFPRPSRATFTPSTKMPTESL